MLVGPISDGVERGRDGEAAGRVREGLSRESCREFPLVGYDISYLFVLCKTFEFYM